jgi:hypothetical protein
MNRLLVSLALFFLSSAEGFCTSAAVPKAPALDYDVPQEELDSLRARAVGGDKDASRRLADYFIFVESNEFEYGLWLRLSAEQGSCESIGRYLQWVENRHSGVSENGGIDVKRFRLQQELCDSK